MKKFVLIIFLISFNLQASEFYNSLLNTNPNMIDFGFLKIELKLEKEKDKIIKNVQNDILYKLQTEFVKAKNINKNENLEDDLSIYIPEKDFHFHLHFDHQKEKILLIFDITIDIDARDYRTFLKNNLNIINSKTICKRVRTEILYPLRVYGPSSDKFWFFNEFFVHQGKKLETEFIKDPNTNLVVKLHWNYYGDEKGRNTTVCMGDMTSEPSYREYDKDLSSVLIDEDNMELYNSY